MRHHFFVIALFFSSLSLTGQAQVRLSININTQPVWGPVGYDHADYYYMPDIETYYSVSNRQYTYFDNGRWVTVGNLPPRYANYDMYHGYKAVINEPTPWRNNDRYRQQYAQYRGRHDQAVIRDSRDQRYYANPGHPEHNNWQRQHDNGRHNGQYNNGHDNDRHDNGHGNQGRGEDNRGRGNDGHGNDKHDNGHDNEGHGNEGHGNEGHGNGHGH